MRNGWSSSGRAWGASVAWLVALISWTQAASGQYPNPAPASQPDRPTPGTSSSRPHFAADAVVQPGESGAPEVRIDYRLPRTELLFERDPAGGYGAQYEIRVIFYSKNRQVAGDVFSRELQVATYAETNTQGQDILDHVSLKVRPGKYVVQVDISDLNAENLSTTSVEIEVPSAPNTQIWFTDLTFGTVSGAPADSARPAFAANPSRHYGEDIVRMAAELQVVDNRASSAPDSIYTLRYQVLGNAPQPVAQGDTTVARKQPRTQVMIRPAFGPLEPGLYRLAVELLAPVPPKSSGKKALPVRREKTFTVDPSAATLWADPNGAIDVLRYIATEQEISEMNALTTPARQKEFWEEFWRRRDPSPGTPENERMDEFYKRVQYANQHFEAGIAGWKTDMGRIYIVNGNPDEVVRNPFNVDRPPEEIWYYYRDRKTFVFVDREGFGRYELDPSRSKQL
jgi:GWxTD domain-containing protein